MAVIDGRGLVPMRVSKVTGLGHPDGNGVDYYAVLEEPDGDRKMVIVTGQSEALALVATLAGTAWPRPMTHQFTAALVRALDGQVKEVRLDRVVNGAYAATVEVAGPAGAARTVDARSTDALNLAVLLGAPVFVAPEVLDDCARRFLDGDSPAAATARRALTSPAIAFAPKD
jgi:hypothetical protein